MKFYRKLNWKKKKLLMIILDLFVILFVFLIIYLFKLYNENKHMLLFALPIILGIMVCNYISSLINYRQIKIDDAQIISIPGFFNFAKKNTYNFGGGWSLFYKFHISKIYKVSILNIEGPLGKFKHRIYFDKKIPGNYITNNNDVILIQLHKPLERDSKSQGYEGYNTINSSDIYVSVDKPKVLLSDISKLLDLDEKSRRNL